ncbi:MAG: hypothetical protein ACHP7P_07820 [Terriglobales bacterium]
MNDLAQEIAKRVVEDTKYFTAIVGLIGVIVGSVLTIIGNVVIHWLNQRAIERQDEPRKKLLQRMLEDKRFPEHWRKLSTLMHVIGADEETTKRLLLEIGARGSEDQQELWGMIKYHPFEKE